MAAPRDTATPQSTHGLPFQSNLEMTQSVPLDDKDPAVMESDLVKAAEFLPSHEETIEALGIPNWRELERQVVKRLDMTLMPCLWVLYLFNYLDRASIA